MSQRLRLLAARLLRDEQGTSLIELGFTAPILAFLVVGVADISNAFGRKLALEQAAQRAIEKIMQTTVTKTVDETIVDEAAVAADVPVENVTLEYWLECNDAGTSVVMDDYDDECDLSGGEFEQRYIVLSITDKYDPIFPAAPGLNADGTYHLSATAGIRTR